MKKKIFLVAICFVVAMFAFNGVSAKVAMPSDGASADEIDKYIKDNCENYGGKDLLAMFDDKDTYFNRVDSWYNTIDKAYHSILYGGDIDYKYKETRFLLSRLRTYVNPDNNDRGDEIRKNKLAQYIKDVKLVAGAPFHTTDKSSTTAMNEAATLVEWVSSDMLKENGKGLNKINYIVLGQWVDTLDAALKAYEDSHNTSGYYSNISTLRNYLYVVYARAKGEDLNYATNKKLQETKYEFNQKALSIADLYICRATSDGSYVWRNDKFTDKSAWVNGKEADKIYRVFKYVVGDTRGVDGAGKDVKECSDMYSSAYNEGLTYEQYSDLYEKYANSAIIGVGNTATVTEYNYFVLSGEVYDAFNTPGNWWAAAWRFLFDGKNSSHQFGTDTGANTALNDIKSMIFDVGNLIFLLVTAYLGVKYIWGGVDSKFTVKNSLMTLVVAAIVFYGWDSVTKILDIPELLTGSAAASGETAMANKIYNTIMYIINFAAVGGIIYIGIRYMMAGADGKAELKLKGIPVVMGIMMVYGTLNFINFILKIVEGL